MKATAKDKRSPSLCLRSAEPPPPTAGRIPGPFGIFANDSGGIAITANSGRNPNTKNGSEVVAWMQTDPPQAYRAWQGETLETARFLARAANAHDGLLVAAKAALELIETHAPRAAICPALLRAAIAKAEGEAEAKSRKAR
jgi:hypothetical protein